MTIPRKFIDVDFTVIPSDQSTGLIEQPPEELLASFGAIPWYDEICASDMVPKDQWKTRAAAIRDDLRRTVAQIYSQGKTSACVGFSAAQACETTFTRTYGIKHRVALSGMSVYDRIGNSLMSGAYIPDGIACLQKDGPLPLDTPENRAKYPVCFPGLSYKWKRPSGWEDVAAMFKVTKAAKASGKEMIASAMLKKRTGIYGRSRHAVPPVYLDFDGNSPMLAYANSWGDWGDEGFGYDSERVFSDLILYVILEVAVRPDLGLPAVAA